MKRIILAASVFLFAACNGIRYHVDMVDGWSRVTQTGGPELGFCAVSGVALLTDNGFAFKDFDRDGELDPYEDWRLSPQERAEDLARKLSIEEIAGLMLYSAHQAVPADTLTAAQEKFLSEDNLRAVLVTSVESPEVAARWNNNLQAFVEGLGHGIPVNNSSDPRHETAGTAEFNAGAGGKISLWPSPLGMAASFDPSLVKCFGQIASREYRALGITTALSPQVDIATDPRWGRFNGTFGEDVALATDMARAYCDGFQTSPEDVQIHGAWGLESVNTMAKHWYGYGAQEGGRDAHYNFGKYAVFPADNREMHKRSFTEGAFALEDGTLMASAVMPVYSILWNQDPSGDNVGGSYSHWMIQQQLRDEAGFDGVVCTDWGITGDNPSVEGFSGKPWGAERLSVSMRHYEILKAGVDQFGGNNDKGPVLEAYEMWVKEYGEKSARLRFERSAVRLLLQVFRTGLFENPYLEVEKTADVVGNPDYMAEGYAAQLRSVVLLKNHSGVLPVKERLKVYVPERYAPPAKDFFGNITKGKWVTPIPEAILEKYYDKVEDPAEADFAIVCIEEPLSGMSAGYEVEDLQHGGNGYVPISLQYRPYTASGARRLSIAGGDPKELSTNRSYYGKTVRTANETDLDLVICTNEKMKGKPVVVVVHMTKPMVMAEIEPWADAVLVDFGVQSQAVLDIVSGAAEPSALLPMQLPADMLTVETQQEDLPHDMRCYVDADGNAYDFAFGLDWSGVIRDERVIRYKPSNSVSTLPTVVLHTK